MYLLGIDVGTSACKIVVFDYTGNIVASSSKEYKVYYPKPNWAEQDPNQWYKAICEGVHEILEKIDGKKIVGIGIDGQGWSCIPVDINGKVLYNTPIWFDTRSTKECDWIEKQIGFERVFKVSGNPVKPSYVTPKVLWFKNNFPNIYNSTYMFLQSNSYIGYRLTGAMTHDKSMGYGHFFYNIASCQYDTQLATEMGIDLDKFPPLLDCHCVIGEITEKASIEIGLPIGIPVVSGGLDAACGTLGAGVFKPGQTQEQGGQAGGMSICMDKPLAHPKLILGNHVVPGLWLLQGGTVGGGGTMKWFSEQLGGGLSFKELDAIAEKIPPASDGVIFIPYMNGERSPIWDVHAKGVYYGLSFSKTKEHLARATMEGVAFSLLHNLKTAEEVWNTINKLYAIGGAAKSDVWMQIKADVTGKPIVVPNSDAASTLGAAILAGVGIGVYKDFSDAISKTVRIEKTYLPNYENSEVYLKVYEKYLKIYKNLKGVMEE